MSSSETERAAPFLIVTGLSGAGRSTAIRALEDAGYEVVDNLPLPLAHRLVEPGSEPRAIAIGLSAGTRGFSAAAVAALMAGLRARSDIAPALIFLEADDAAILARYSETRRRHPAAPEESVEQGVSRERLSLAPLRAEADALIDTSVMTPHELKAAMAQRFGGDRAPGLTLSIQSFSYKRGAPRDADMTIDCRFLRNPYWSEHLRPRDGREPEVAAHVAGDPLYASFFEKLAEMAELLLPAYRREGKSHFLLGLGCTGGRHRSVAVAEALSARLRAGGWRVNLRHRDLERAP